MVNVQYNLCSLHYMEDHGCNYNHKFSHFVTSLNFGANCLIRLKPKIVPNFVFFSNLYSSQQPEIENTIFRLEAESHFYVWLTYWERSYDRTYTTSFWNCCYFFQETSNRHSEKWMWWLYTIYGNFYRKKSWSKSFKNNSLTISLFSNAPLQLFPSKSLSTFRKSFFQTNWILKVNGSLQCQNHLTPQSGRILQGGYSCCSIRKPSKC